MTPGTATGPAIDPRTLLLGLMRRVPILAVFVLLAVGLGVLAGLRMGRRTWLAETVLLYKPEALTRQGATGQDAPNLRTLRDLVMIRENLAVVRERLQLPTKVKTLGRACRARVGHGTQLLVIHAQWGDPDAAAAIANSLRDVFLQRQRAKHRGAAGPVVSDLEELLAQARAELDLAESRKRAFGRRYPAATRGPQIRRNAEEMAAIAGLLEQSRLEQMAGDEEAAHFDQAMAALRDRAKKEQEATGRPQKAVSTSARVEEIRKSIEQDKGHRANTAKLAARELALERAKVLKAKGIISQAELDRVASEYEQQKIVTVDTEEIKQLRAEMERLSAVSEAPPGGESPLTAMLREMMPRYFDVHLRRTVSAERVRQLEAALAEMSGNMERLPPDQRQAMALVADAATVRARTEAIEDKLAEAAGFRVEMEATPPLTPVKSNRKLIAAGIFVVVCGLGFLLILALELLDTTIKSSDDLEVRLGLPVLAVIPRSPVDYILFGGEEAGQPVEPFRILAHHLRLALPDRGARVVITSTDYGEGKSLVAANLASCLGRQGEKVLLVDAQLRPMSYRGDSARHHLAELAASSRGPQMGLGDYLSARTDRIEDVVRPDVLSGVDLMTCGSGTATPELLASETMRALMQHLGSRYSVVLVEAPPVRPFVDAESLTRWMDGVLLVVRSRTTPADPLRKAVRRLRASGVPIVGAALNAVDPLYLGRLSRRGST